MKRQNRETQEFVKAARATVPEATDAGGIRAAVTRKIRLKKILVPVDFSDPSRKALDYALALARKFGAEIHLLHVAEPVPVPVTTDPIGGLARFDFASTDEFARKKLGEWRAEAGPGTFVRATVCSGRPHHEIVKAAAEGGFDLIILGHQGRTGLARLLLGSTAEHVLRRAPCPTLVVREPEHEFIVDAEAEPFQTSNQASAGMPATQPRQTS